jgi:hypothetical protein
MVKPSRSHTHIIVGYAYATLFVALTFVLPTLGWAGLNCYVLNCKCLVKLHQHYVPYPHPAVANWPCAHCHIIWLARNVSVVVLMLADVGGGVRVDRCV